ncbi:MAG: ATP-binding protein [Vicinamibacterales bacterium]
MTRAIYLGTLAALLVVATLSVLIYRSTVNSVIEQHSLQQLAMVRTGGAAIQGELRGLSALLRQFNSIPSVQNLDVPFLGQRIGAAFGQNPNGIVRFIARIDAEGRFYYWTPSGQLQPGSGNLVPELPDWSWFTDPANQGQSRVVNSWGRATPTLHYRSLTMPVWRTAPSGENPNPSNDFNGAVALVFDLNRLVEVYLGPALTDLADEQLVVGLATPDLGLRLGLGRNGVMAGSGDSHGHQDAQGTSTLDDANGRRLHAWSKLDVANESWLVASSLQYGRVANQIQRTAAGQLALMAVMLVAVPLGGWLLARRERRSQEGQRRLERQLAESQKMEAIGKLAGGVAHDFNNMLTAILGYASLIGEDAPANSPIREQAAQIRRAAESAGALTQKLLAFSRRQVLQTNQFDFTAMLDNLLLLVRRVIGAHISVTSQAQPGLWPVLADPSQVEQSILNMAINARDAMPDGGTLQIAASNAPLPHGERRPDGDVRPGDYVRITITDSGTGMDESTRDRMFEPFFTTKPHGQGTGLGLSTVYGFVRQCGGYIGVTTAIGRGTSIELLLPRAPAAPPPTPAARPASPARASDAAGKETVLIAEDEEAVRWLAVESLERAGYAVLKAASGEEALRVADAFDGTIHVLVTDVVMPGIKGPELARRLRLARPSIRVLLMSGYAADVVTKEDLAEAALLSKPFSPSALTKAVRQAMDRPLSPGPPAKG